MSVFSWTACECVRIPFSPSLLWLQYAGNSCFQKPFFSLFHVLRSFTGFDLWTPHYKCSLSSNMPLQNSEGSVTCCKTACGVKNTSATSTMWINSVWVYWLFIYSRVLKSAPSGFASGRAGSFQFVMLSVCSFCLVLSFTNLFCRQTELQLDVEVPLSCTSSSS